MKGKDICPKCNKKITKDHPKHIHGTYDTTTKKFTRTIEHIDCENPTKPYEFPKRRCQYCGQELNEVRVGLINFGDMNHYKNCPAYQFEHCPNCGTDIDMLNSYQYRQMKGIKK